MSLFSLGQGNTAALLANLVRAMERAAPTAASRARPRAAWARAFARAPSNVVGGCAGPRRRRAAPRRARVLRTLVMLQPCGGGAASGGCKQR